MADSVKVALLVETSHGYGRGLLRGVMKYSRLHGPWQFHLIPGGLEQIVPRMKDWKGNGIIARIINPKTAATLMKTGLPLVVLDLPEGVDDTFRKNNVRYVELVSDSEGVTQMAVEHLLGKQFRHYAFVGYHGSVWSKKREKLFSDRILREGHDIHLYRIPLCHGVPLPWEKEAPRMAQWLKTLPKPIGIMACNDQRGREVLDACGLAGISVPEEAAVIGIDNDELLCELSSPPLSSVALHTVQSGYQAAAILHEMIQKPRLTHKKVIVPPLHIVERRSTESTMIDDPAVVAALRFIHTSKLPTLTITNVVKSTFVSRRMLEIRFRKLLKSTILQEIKKVRLARAKQLLLETDFSLDRIAEVVGFETGSYFAQFFRKEAGMTPSKFKRKAQIN